MRFIDHDGICSTGERSDFLRMLLAAQIGVRENIEAADALIRHQVRKVFLQIGAPHGIACRFRHEQDDSLVLMNDEFFEQHQTDERFAETHTIAQESAAIFCGALHHHCGSRCAGTHRVTGKFWNAFRPTRLPVGNCDGKARIESVTKYRMV